VGVELKLFACWLHSANITVLLRSFGVDGYFAFFVAENFFLGMTESFVFLSFLRFVFVAVLI
jgi:hypothetical protein